MAINKIHINNPTSLDDISFSLPKNSTFSACAEEISSQIPDKTTFQILKDLCEINGFDGIHDPRLSTLDSFEDNPDISFKLPDYAKGLFLQSTIAANVEDSNPVHGSEQTSYNYTDYFSSSEPDGLPVLYSPEPNLFEPDLLTPHIPRYGSSGLWTKEYYNLSPSEVSSTNADETNDYYDPSEPLILSRSKIDEFNLDPEAHIERIAGEAQRELNEAALHIIENDPEFATSEPEDVYPFMTDALLSRNEITLNYFAYELVLLHENSMYGTEAYLSIEDQLKELIDSSYQEAAAKLDNTNFEENNLST